MGCCVGQLSESEHPCAPQIAIIKIKIWYITAACLQPARKRERKKSFTSLYHLQDIIALILPNRWDCPTGESSDCFVVVSLGGHVIEKNKIKQTTHCCLIFIGILALKWSQRHPTIGWNGSVASIPFEGWQTQSDEGCSPAGLPSHQVDNSSPLEFSCPYWDQLSSWWDRKPCWTVYNHLKEEEA